MKININEYVRLIEDLTSEIQTYTDETQNYMAQVE